MKTIIALVFAIWLALTISGCSSALIDNDYNKSGPTSYAKSKGSYDRMVIIIKKPQSVRREEK